MPKKSDTPKAIVPEEKPTEEEIAKKRMQEVEILQNDGVFRAELLHRLNELCEIPKQLYILNALIDKTFGDEEDDKKDN